MNEIIYFNPVLLIAVPLALAFLSPLLGLISKKSVKYLPVAGFLANTGIAVSLIPRAIEQTIVVRIGGFPPPFCINLVAGPAGILLSFLIAVTGFLVALYSLRYINQDGEEKYHVLYLLLLTGATGVVLTGDIFNLFVFFEILCISSYALVAFFGHKAGIEASVKYLIQGSVGSSLLLLGIGFLYGRTGTLNMAGIALFIQNTSPGEMLIPLFFIITGLGIEAAVFPLNAWLPDAHSSAPASISAVLSGIAIEVGLYAVIRMLFTIFGVTELFPVFMVLGVTTLVIGEMCAFTQQNLKRMLAFSSIGQIGLILFAVSLATSQAVAGGIFQMLSHTAGKALLFLTAGYMILNTGSHDIESFRGIGRRMPLISLGFTAGVFSLVGLPPFMGFASKFSIIRAALSLGNTWVYIMTGFVLTATVIEASYFFRVIQVIYFHNNEKPGSALKVPASSLAPILLLMAVIIIIGIFPGILTDLLHNAAGDIANKIDYIRSVLG